MGVFSAGRRWSWCRSQRTHSKLCGSISRRLQRKMSLLEHEAELRGAAPGITAAASLHQTEALRDADSPADFMQDKGGRSRTSSQRPRCTFGRRKDPSHHSSQGFSCGFGSLDWSRFPQTQFECFSSLLWNQRPK